MAADSMILPKMLRDKYDAVKAQYPDEGRRRIHLRVAQKFWSLSLADRQAIAEAPFTLDENIPAYMDPDPCDAVVNHSPALGIIVRTDYTNDVAWAAFVEQLEDAEQEYHSTAASTAQDDDTTTGTGEGSTPETESGGDAATDNDSDSASTSSPPPPIFQFLAPPSSYPLQPYLHNASNLTLLRLLTSVTIAPAPKPPPPPPLPPYPPRAPHPLVDDGGWVEAYVGKGLWVYDAKSNRDQCVRVVGPAPGGYGFATADSWRARVVHIPELQAALASGGLRIDFGGHDRWDATVRAENMAEALIPFQ